METACYVRRQRGGKDGYMGFRLCPFIFPAKEFFTFISVFFLYLNEFVCLHAHSFSPCVADEDMHVRGACITNLSMA